MTSMIMEIIGESLKKGALWCIKKAISAANVAFLGYEVGTHVAETSQVKEEKQIVVNLTKEEDKSVRIDTIILIFIGIGCLIAFSAFVCTKFQNRDKKQPQININLKDLNAKVTESTSAASNV